MIERGYSNNKFYGSDYLTEIYQSICHINGLEIELQRFFDVLIKYVNAIPKWIFSGYSVNVEVIEIDKQRCIQSMILRFIMLGKELLPFVLLELKELAEMNAKRRENTLKL